MNYLFASNSDIVREFGGRIKENRLAANMTQAEIANHTGLSLLTIKNLEDGKNVGIYVYVKVLRALNLLDYASGFIPDNEISPIAIWERDAKKRQRGTGRKKTKKT